MTRPLTYYVPRYTPRLDSPIRIHALTETSLIYPDVPHSWLSDGRLLLLHDPDNPENAKMFQVRTRGLFENELMRVRSNYESLRSMSLHDRFSNFE